MNSVVQVLKTLPEFRQGLEKMVPAASGGANAFGMDDASFVVSLRQLLNELESTTDVVTPMDFVMRLRRRFPQFAQQVGNPPAFQQQDAEEYLREMLSVVGNVTKGAVEGGVGERAERGGLDRNLVDDLFGFKMVSK